MDCKKTVEKCVCSHTPAAFRYTQVCSVRHQANAKNYEYNHAYFLHAAFFTEEILKQKLMISQIALRVCVC